MMRSFELVAGGKLTPQLQAEVLDQRLALRLADVEFDTGAAFARRGVSA